MKRLILAVLIIPVTLLGACASPPATIESPPATIESPPATIESPPATIKRVNTNSENMDADADLELVVEFTLANDKQEVVVANGKVTYVFLYKNTIILSRETLHKKSDLPIYFDREDFRVACPICEGTGFATCPLCKGAGGVDPAYDRPMTMEKIREAAEYFLEHGRGLVECPRCGGSGRAKCPDKHCKGGISDLSGAPLTLIVKFEREDGVTLEGTLSFIVEAWR